MNKDKKEVIKPVITSRVLFVTVLDKIYLIALGLIALGTLYRVCFIVPGVWNKLLYLAIDSVVIVLLYLYFNWLYKCVAKTMICLINNEVYIEKYVPFYRTEKSIPLNKITSVTTHKFFWIFRILVIHQYGKLPTIFYTWTNQEFKDKLVEAITSDKGEVENTAKNQNLIRKEYYKALKIAGIVVGALVLISIIAEIISSISYSIKVKKISGTYVYEKEQIVLNKNGDCDIDEKDKCKWEYNKVTECIDVSYEYSYGYSSYTYTSSISLDYDLDKNIITYNSEDYKKQ